MAKVIKTNREVIENKLLTALQEDGVVAALLTEADLTLLITGMHLLVHGGRVDPESPEYSLLRDMKVLRKKAFGK